MSAYAGLWLRVDPNVAFDNMQARKINGTNEWAKYEIELDYNSSADTVVVGGCYLAVEKTDDIYPKSAVSGYHSWYVRGDDSPNFERLEDNVGYVTLRNISLDDVDVIKEEFKNTAGIIIDFDTKFLVYNSFW